jgi:hypothetical protein
MLLKEMLNNSIEVGIIGIGENCDKLIGDFKYIFRDKIRTGEIIKPDDGCSLDKKSDYYVCCTYDRRFAEETLKRAGLNYKTDYLFAEDCFSLLDDWKNSRIAFMSYPGSAKGWLENIIFGYAAKHGKVLYKDRYRDILNGRYEGAEGNRYGKHLAQNNKSKGKRLVYVLYFFLGFWGCLPQIFAKKVKHEKYEHICFNSVSDALRYKKDYPEAGEKVVTIDQLKAHTMASLYMKAVYFDQRQNGCMCETPFNTLWIGEGGTTRLCGCPDYLDISCGNAGVTNCSEIWQSPLADIMRLSVMNNTYTFCSRELCRKFNANKDQKTLLKRKENTWNRDYPGIIKVANDYVCNLHCPSCRKRILVKNDTNTEMEIEACTNDLLKSGWLEKAEKLVIGASGETFLSPNYRRILYDGEVKRNSISIMTNGTLFTPQEWEKMEGKYDHIGFSVSVDAATKETYAKVRCGGNFDRLMENMKFLSKLRKDGKVDEVIVNMVVQKANYKEIPDFIRWAKEMDFDGVYLSHLWNWGTYTDEEFENNVSMFDKNGNMKEDLALILEDPICKDPIVDMRWNAD